MLDISILNIIFMSLPEFIVLILTINILVGKKLNQKDIKQMCIIYTIICYVVINSIDHGMITIFLNVALILLTYIYCKVKIIYCIIVSALSIGLKFAVDFMVIGVINLLGFDISAILSNSFLKIVVSYIPLTVMLGLIYFTSNRYEINIVNIFNRKNKTRERWIEKITLYISILITLFAALTVIVTYYNKTIYYDLQSLFVIGILLCLIIALSVLVCFILIYNKKKSLTEIENNLIANTLKQMEDTVDVLRLQRHDYMNHLQVILMQVANGKNEEARNYILSISKENHNTSSYYSTGNSYMDAILNTKKRRSMKYDIEFTACIDSMLEDINLSESELSSVLLNIIDNAIDELKKREDSDKYIHVDVYRNDCIHNISIKNNGSKIKDVKKIFEMGYSSKGENRGYGLYSIKKMLESYGCKIQVYSDDDETEFEVQIPIN